MKTAIETGQAGREDTETRLLNQELDFSGSYMAVKSINDKFQRSPQTVTDKTINALIFLIQSKKFDSQKQALFLFRETAETLISIIIELDESVDERADESPAGKIIPELQKIMINSTGHRHRAVAEALGSLPFAVTPPEMPKSVETETCTLSFCQLLKALEIEEQAQFSWRGRSLTAPAKKNRIGVIKFVKCHEDPMAITTETRWMDFFKTAHGFDRVDFDIPQPMKEKGISLFKIIDIPETITLPEIVHEHRFAIAFSASKTYYDYPNDPLNTSDPNNPIDLPRILGLNARLLGQTAALGVVHTAAIPLFHNRVQQDRRQDSGIYQWERSGRLDQWLESCRHPNFAVSGLRDFEHFDFIMDIKSLHHHIGSHLLSLILVAGSFFRNTCPEKKGNDSLGMPVDARQLFDPCLFKEAIAAAITQYYSGFTGHKTPDYFPPPPMELVDDLIDKMGVDRHMEEILRIEDQNRMDNDQFRIFLMERGLTPEQTIVHERGKANISIDTGPHLGGFNQGISVPQLIDYIFSWASLCVCGRYLQENGLKQSSL